MTRGDGAEAVNWQRDEAGVAVGQLFASIRRCIDRTLDCSAPFWDTNNGAGVFTATYNNAPNYSISLELADMNGDGELDIVLGATVGGAISTLLGAGDGTFHTRRDYAVGGPAYGVDVVAAIAQATNNVVVFTNNGDGSLTRALTLTMPGTGVDPVGAVVGDFDRDGKGDTAVVSDRGGDLLYVLRNTCP